MGKRDCGQGVVYDEGAVLGLVAQLVRLTASGHMRWQCFLVEDSHSPHHRIPGVSPQHTYESAFQGMGFLLDCTERQAVMLSVGHTGLQVVSNRIGRDYMPLAVRTQQTESVLEDPLDVLRHVIISDDKKLEGNHRIISVEELSNELSMVGLEDVAGDL